MIRQEDQIEMKSWKALDVIGSHRNYRTRKRDRLRAVIKEE